MLSEWTKIGVVGVDSGQLVLMDPCYIKTVPDEYHGQSWERYEERPIEPDNHQRTFQHKFDMGHDGLAVSFSSGWGDGVYDVFARFLDGRVAEVKVVMLREDDDEE